MRAPSQIKAQSKKVLGAQVHKLDFNKRLKGFKIEPSSPMKLWFAILIFLRLSISEPQMCRILGFYTRLLQCSIL